MFKYMKLPSILFLVIVVLLTGCGDSSTPYKKGDKFLEEYDSKRGKSSIEIISEDKWKYTNEGNGKSAIYDVEETEFIAGKYKVIKVMKPNKHSEQDPWVIKTGEYYLIGMNSDDFSLIHVGRVDALALDDWEYLKQGYDKGRDFKKDYSEAKDKEIFLKSVADRSALKYTKKYTYKN